MRILLDLDQVLADFVGAALRVHGWTRKRLEQVWVAGTWSIVEPMGLTKEQFWEPINQAGSQFWVGLEPLPWFYDLVELVRSKTDDWHIVSSPSRSDSSYLGKTLWLKRYFGEDFDQFAITPHKYIFAKSGVLLIDDREETVARFVAEGGDGLVFPSRHNQLYYEAGDPVGYVARILKEQKDGVQIS